MPPERSSKGAAARSRSRSPARASGTSRGGGDKIRDSGSFTRSVSHEYEESGLVISEPELPEPSWLESSESESEAVSDREPPPPPAVAGAQPQSQYDVINAKLDALEQQMNDVIKQHLAGARAEEFIRKIEPIRRKFEEQREASSAVAERKDENSKVEKRRRKRRKKAKV